MLSHLASKHARHLSARIGAQRAAIYAEAMKVNLWDPALEPFHTPPPDARPIRGLPVYDSYRCPEESCTYTARQPSSIQNHRRQAHVSSTGRRGRLNREDRSKLQPVKCQRFFLFGICSSYFVVTPAADERRTRRALDMTESDFIQA